MRFDLRNYNSLKRILFFSNLSHINIKYKQIVGKKLSANFRDATVIEEKTIPPTIPAENVIIKIKYTGINASDINYTAGRYDPTAQLPLYPGFEAVGNIVAVGSKVEKIKIGDPCMILGSGCFAEYAILPSVRVTKVPFVSPQVISLSVSALTAAVGLYEVGQMTTKETVLVTAAAGGTGIFAVQLAKLAGNHVIGTCSTDEKAAYLKTIGCDRVINYKKESLFQVLKKEYPKGVNLVYESVGGDTFDACVSNMAIKGRLVIIGFIGGYLDQSGWQDKSGGKGASISAKLLGKSASIRGCFVNHYSSTFHKHTTAILKLMQEGKLEAKVDDTNFTGIESIAKAIDHMYQGKNLGKVVVELNPESKL